MVKKELMNFAKGSKAKHNAHMPTSFPSSVSLLCFYVVELLNEN